MEPNSDVGTLDQVDWQDYGLIWMVNRGGPIFIYRCSLASLDSSSLPVFQPFSWHPFPSSLPSRAPSLHTAILSLGNLFVFVLTQLCSIEPWSSPRIRSLGASTTILSRSSLSSSPRHSKSSPFLCGLLLHGREDTFRPARERQKNVIFHSKMFCSGCSCARVRGAWAIHSQSIGLLINSTNWKDVMVSLLACLIGTCPASVGQYGSNNACRLVQSKKLFKILANLLDRAEAAAATDECANYVTNYCPLGEDV